MRRWRRVAGVLAVDAVLMAGWYWMTMARLRSLPPSIRWDGGTIVDLLIPFTVALGFANVTVLTVLTGVWRDRDARAATAVTLILAIAAFAAALFFLGMALLMLFAQY